MSSSAVFQKTSSQSLGWNTGRSGFSEPGCHNIYMVSLMLEIIKSFYLREAPSYSGVSTFKDVFCMSVRLDPNTW